jgi:IS4 transposase
MPFSAILDRFVQKCPAVVMVRGTFEHLLKPGLLDEIFEETAQRQYHKQLLFSEVVAIMTAVVLRSHMSVHSAFQASRKQLGVSHAALYAKLNNTELAVSVQMVSQTAKQAKAVIDAMRGAHLCVLPGLQVHYLDGNHLAGTEHRLAVTRVTREGVLPGQSLALLDGQTGLISELILCEDSYSQERSMLPELLEKILPGMVIIADRNFCTGKFFTSLAEKEAFFAIRQHGSTLTYELPGKRRKIGATDTGVVYEQKLQLTHETKTMTLRRITVDLYEPTDAGDEQIHVITNLGQKQATAVQVAQAYKTRWTIEGAFQQMTDVLCCEIRTLGYPKAALFAFAVATLAYNTYAVVKAALRAAHGQDKIAHEFSDYHLVNEVALACTTMDIVIDPGEWEQYHKASPRKIAQLLVGLARKVDLERYPKKKRGPKKPRSPNRKSGLINHHVSTARLLEDKKKKMKVRNKKTP